MSLTIPNIGDESKADISAKWEFGKLNNPKQSPSTKQFNRMILFNNKIILSSQDCTIN